jgi:hypothetical protein
MCAQSAPAGRSFGFFSVPMRFSLLPPGYFTNDAFGMPAVDVLVRLCTLAYSFAVNGALTRQVFVPGYLFVGRHNL